MNTALYIHKLKGEKMVTAYLFINLKRGGETSIGDKLKNLDGVLEYSLLYGEYDAILKVKKSSMEELQKFLIQDIRKINDIENTSTMICVNDE